MPRELPIFVYRDDLSGDETLPPQTYAGVGDVLVLLNTTGSMYQVSATEGGDFLQPPLRGKVALPPGAPNRSYRIKANGRVILHFEPLKSKGEHAKPGKNDLLSPDAAGDPEIIIGGGGPIPLGKSR